MRLSTSTWNQYYCLLSLLIFCANIHNAVSKITFVKREKAGDKFGLVSSSSKCGRINANNAGQVGKMIVCQCFHGYSTFLVSRKACVANSVTKGILFKNSDCSELLRLDIQYGESTPYIVLDLQQASQKKFYENQVKGITGKNCTVDNTLYYIDDQTENQMSVNAGNVFSINTSKKALKWQSLPSSFSNLNGRVLRLVPTGCTISTTVTSSVNKPCIILKAEGKVTFSTASVVSPTATLHPSTISSTQAVSTSSVVSPTATLHPSTISSTQTGTRSSVVPQPSSILVTTTTAPIQSSSVIPVKPTPVQSSNTPYHTQTVPAGTPTTPANNFSPTASKRKDKQSSPIGAIVGSVMAVIAIVVIIVVIIIWRRRKTTSGQNSKPQKGPNTPENPTYANGSEIIALSKQKQASQSTDNDFEYDYAVVDGIPRSSSNAAPGIYQSLTKDPNRESVYTPLDRQQGNPSDQSTGYDKVERPIFKPARKGPADPLYNVLERPIEGQLEPGTHDTPTGQSTGYEKVERPVFKTPRKGPTDPLYNVLERPNGNNHDYMEPGVNIDKAPQNNEPVYNVLEGPGEDPDYNVLEDPNEQYEPEYNVLEGPGDKPDNVPVDGHDNVGYASTIDLKSRGAPIYAAPEGPISEPTYQPLNVNGPDENVYQPLDRKSRVVPDDQPLYHVLESTTSDA